MPVGIFDWYAAPLEVERLGPNSIYSVSPKGRGIAIFGVLGSINDSGKPVTLDVGGHGVHVDTPDLLAGFIAAAMVGLDRIFGRSDLQAWALI